MLGYLARGEEVNILDRLLRSLLLVHLTWILVYRWEYLYINNNKQDKNYNVIYIYIYIYIFIFDV